MTQFQCPCWYINENAVLKFPAFTGLECIFTFRFNYICFIYLCIYCMHLCLLDELVLFSIYTNLPYHFYSFFIPSKSALSVLSIATMLTLVSLYVGYIFPALHFQSWVHLYQCSEFLRTGIFLSLTYLPMNPANRIHSQSRLLVGKNLLL